MLTPDRTMRALAGWLGITVVIELVLLRTGTRTLIHIPGLGRFDFSIDTLSELGRIAYYMAIVLVLATLLRVGWRCWLTGSSRGRLVAALAWSFVTIAMLGRIGLIPGTAVAWLSVVSMVGVLAVTWGGARSLPIAFFVAASAFASWSVLGQGTGGGLTGPAVDVTIVIAEALFLLAGVSAPLLVRGRATKGALVAGVAAALVVAAGFSVGGPTIAILTLWNLGVPGWFAPIAHGLALGGLAFTLWSAIANRMTLTASAVLLIVAGGVGPISTYQSALALTAVALIGVYASVPFETPNELESAAGGTEMPADLVPLS